MVSPFHVAANLRKGSGDRVALRRSKKVIELRKWQR